MFYPNMECPSGEDKIESNRIRKHPTSDLKEKHETAQVYLMVPWSTTVMKGVIQWNQNISRFLLSDHLQKHEPAQV